MSVEEPGQHSKGMRDECNTPQHPRDHNLMRDDPGPFSIQARYITIPLLAAVSETDLAGEHDRQRKQPADTVMQQR